MVGRAYLPPAASVEWGTPLDLFADLDAEFHFDLDVAASATNHLCARYLTRAEDALTAPWPGQRCYCNPPYGRQIRQWVQRAVEESLYHDKLVVMLVPARTDTVWFHRYLWCRRYHRPVSGVQLRFLPGRLRYVLPGGAAQPAPFPSLVVVLGRSDHE